MTSNENSRTCPKQYKSQDQNRDQKPNPNPRDPWGVIALSPGQHKKNHLDMWAGGKKKCPSNRATSIWWLAGGKMKIVSPAQPEFSHFPSAARPLLRSPFMIPFSAWHANYNDNE